MDGRFAVTPCHRVIRGTGDLGGYRWGESSPAIYVHEWASFSTKDFPGNKRARTGDTVRIVTTEIADQRPAEDVLWDDEAYAEVFRRSGLKVIAKHRPLATGNEPYGWVNETTIAPWVIYVVERIC
jgi:hypothetical protein